VTNVPLTTLINSNGQYLTNLNAANLTGTLTNNTTGNAAYATNAGTAVLATNVVSGIGITNAFVTNSVFAGNGTGLTNLQATNIVGGGSTTNFNNINVTNTATIGTVQSTNITDPLGSDFIRIDNGSQNMTLSASNINYLGYQSFGESSHVDYNWANEFNSFESDANGAIPGGGAIAKFLSSTANAAFVITTTVDSPNLALGAGPFNNDAIGPNDIFIQNGGTTPAYLNLLDGNGQVADDSMFKVSEVQVGVTGGLGWDGTANIFLDGDTGNINLGGSVNANGAYSDGSGDYFGTSAFSSGGFSDGASDYMSGGTVGAAGVYMGYYNGNSGCMASAYNVEDDGNGNASVYSFTIGGEYGAFTPLVVYCANGGMGTPGDLAFKIAYPDTVQTFKNILDDGGGNATFKGSVTAGSVTAANGIASYATNIVASASANGYTNTSGINMVANISGTSGTYVFLNRSGTNGTVVCGTSLFTNTVLTTGSTLPVPVNCGIHVVSGVGVKIQVYAN
jgi:hypothetical protein